MKNNKLSKVGKKVKSASKKVLKQTKKILNRAEKKGGKMVKVIKKEWKKRLRSMDPLEYKAMVEENENLRVETNYLNKSVATNKKELDSLKSEVEVLKSTVDVQKESYNELMSKFEKANDSNKFYKID
jgi:chromosome segregation ATPase